MTRGPERHYPDEASRLRAERLSERRKEACREAAPMFFYNQVLEALEADGTIDTPAGDRLVRVEIENGELVATIFKADRSVSG